MTTSSTPTETISQFGHFTPEGFVAHHTPHRRWMNIHHNRFNDGTNHSLEFSAFTSQYGDGPISFRCEDGTHVQLVNWESMGFYVRDDESGLAFSPSGAPLPTEVNDLKVTYGLGSTRIASSCNGLAVEERIFVPLRDPVRISTLTLTNQTNKPRSISVILGVRFDLGPSPRPTVDIHPELGGVFVWRYDSTGIDTWSRGFLCVTSDFHAATGHREDFFGPALDFSSPRLIKGHDLSNIPGNEFNECGAVQAKVTLAPNETRRLDFLLGHAGSPEQALALRQAMTPERIDELAREVEDEEKHRAEAFTIETGHPNLDALFNQFSKKQLNVYLAHKSGYRDNLQLCYALSMVDAPLAESALLLLLSKQYASGFAPHCFRPFKTTPYSDSPVWLFAAVSWHIQQTGDLSFLDRCIPFSDDPKPTSVLDHLKRAMQWLIHDTRTHGLCDLRHGDWNDGLASAEGDDEGRESVMVTEQLCHGLLELATLADRIKDTALAAEARQWHAEFAHRINATAWDGEWYQRVLCDDGIALGTHTAEEGKIFINSQSWAVIGQIAPPDRAVQCLDSIEKHLKIDIGYRAVAPGFSRFDPHVGQSSIVFPGITENGGCYNHAAGFKVVADCLMGRAEIAWDTLLKVAPDNPENPEIHSRMEPFAFNNQYYADAYNYGRTMNAWTTGTCPWFVIATVEYILGVRRDYDGLRIIPCLTKRVPHARVVRKFRGATFDIHLDNSAGRCTGLTSLTCDGVAIGGNQLPDFREGTHRVEAVI